jgi:DNA mismatch endonuclease, patch repair protein
MEIQPKHPTSPVRSRIMQSVGQKDTDIEMRLRRGLWARGLRYRLHRRVSGTKPDLTFRSARVAIFVDGCFWHGCRQCNKAPKSNSRFWRDKISRNRERDVQDTLRLEADDWKVLRFWGCEIRSKLHQVIQRIEEEVHP